MAKHRWTWPDVASVLTQWLTSKQIEELTGNAQATKGKSFGRMFQHTDAQGVARWVAVARRESGEGESGKFRYRLIDLASMVDYYARMDLENFQLHEPSIGLRVRTFIPAHTIMPRMQITSTYNPKLPPLLKEYGAAWDKDYRIWEVGDERRFGDVIAALEDFYGLGREGRAFTLHVRADAVLPSLIRYQNAYLCERRVLRRSKKWAKFDAGHGVYIKHASDPEQMTLIIEDVSAAIYESVVTTLGEHLVHVETFEEGTTHEGAVQVFQKKAWGEALRARAWEVIRREGDLS